MAQIQTFSCDVCQIQRQTTNHWWCAFFVDGGLLLLRWEAADTEHDPAKADAHLCGEQHVHEWVSKHLFGKGTS